MDDIYEREFEVPARGIRMKIGRAIVEYQDGIFHVRCPDDWAVRVLQLDKNGGDGQNTDESN